MNQCIRGAMVIILATVLSAGSASLAGAQGTAESAEPTSRAESKENRSKRESRSSEAPAPVAKNYDFEGDAIDGARVRPDGTTIFGLEAAGHQRLIRLRHHFMGDIIESAEWL
jgi:hypothetical protein